MTTPPLSLRVPPRLEFAILAAVVVLAVWLRVDGIAWGLPHALTNPDELVVVPKGFHIAQGSLNPHFFLYPSLLFNTLAVVDLTIAPFLGSGALSDAAFTVDPTAWFLAGRLVSAVFGVATVVLVYGLARSSFDSATGLLAALFMAVLPLHVTYSKMAVTDVMATALGTAALWALVTATRTRTDPARLLVVGAALAGLATSTKYNLGMLVLACVVAGILVSRATAASALRTFGLCLAVPFVAAFVAGSPFTLIDAPSFVSDFIRQNRIQARGWLGFEHVGNGLVYNIATNLRGAIGVVLLVLAAVGLVRAAMQRTHADWILVPYACICLAYISTWNALAARYLMPLLPIAAILGARVVIAAASHRWPGRLRRSALGVAAAVTAVVAGSMALATSVRANRRLSGDDTRLAAARWITANLPTGTTIASEASGPPIVSDTTRSAYRSRGRVPPATYRVVELRLPGPGRPEPTLTWDFLRANRVDYVVRSSAVDDRVMAAADVYPDIVAFYQRLDREAPTVATFVPGPGRPGPRITIHRMPTPDRADRGGTGPALTPHGAG